MLSYYKLINRQVLPSYIGDPEASERRINSSCFRVWKGTKRVPIWVSTVFLFVDCNMYDDSGPILFETAVFWGDPNKSSFKSTLLERFEYRYKSYAQASLGHKRICNKITKVFQRGKKL